MKFYLAENDAVRQCYLVVVASVKVGLNFRMETFTIPDRSAKDTCTLSDVHVASLL